MISILFSLLLSTNSFAKTDSFCLDSDGGIKPEKKGKITIRLPKTNVLNMDSDYCLDGNTLVELYCDEKGEPQQKSVKCPCNKGACKK